MKLFSRFFVLLVLTGGLFLAASGSASQASALICCSDCDEYLEWCVRNCTFSDRACIEKCESEYDSCYFGPPACDSSC